MENIYFFKFDSDPLIFVNTGPGHHRLSALDQTIYLQGPTPGPCILPKYPSTHSKYMSIQNKKNSSKNIITDTVTIKDFFINSLFPVKEWTHENKVCMRRRYVFLQHTSSWSFSYDKFCLFVCFILRLFPTLFQAYL
jgi:hypothetical protein